METESDSIRIDNREIYYQRIMHEPGGGQPRPVLVFLHEALGSVRGWADFPAKIAGRTGLDALVFDRRGYGRSSPYDYRNNLRYMHEEAEFLDEFLAAVQVRRPLLVGHSDGGSIALIYAALYTEVPAAVVTIAAHTIVEPICVRGARAAGESFRNGNLRKKLMRLHDDKSETVFYSWHDNWTHPDFPNWEIESLLPRIKCPVYAIQGENDEYGTALQLESIAENAPHAETYVIPECRHIPHLQAKNQTIELISEFIDKINFD
jgi:pimeloyl-ACP methyl ester carboxylesterase